MIVWHCLYCGKELDKSEYSVEGKALEVLKKMQDRLDYLSDRCDCGEKDRKLYTNWYKDGVALSRREYYKLTYDARNERKGIKEYLIEQGYKWWKISNDDIKAQEKKIKTYSERGLKLTNWKDTNGEYINKAEYDRLAKHAQREGISNSEYLYDLGYTITSHIRRE